MCVVPHNTTRLWRIECNHLRGGHEGGGSSWGGLWEQLSPIISWIEAETRVYGAIQVKTLHYVDLGPLCMRARNRM